MSSPYLTNATADITKATDVIKGATILINSFKSMLDKAVADAIGNGATEAELKPLSDLSDVMEAETDTLAAAVAANTPAAPTT